MKIPINITYKTAQFFALLFGISFVSTMILWITLRLGLAQPTEPLAFVAIYLRYPLAVMTFSAVIIRNKLKVKKTIPSEITKELKKYIAINFALFVLYAILSFGLVSAAIFLGDRISSLQRGGLISIGAALSFGAAVTIAEAFKYLRQLRAAENGR